MPSKETPKKEPSALSRKVTRAWKRGKGWLTLPSRERKPLSPAQARNAFYSSVFDLENLLSIIRRLEREGDTRTVGRLKEEANRMAQRLAWEFHSHAMTRALRANRILDPKVKRDVRRSLEWVSANPSVENAVIQNDRMRKILGKKYAPFARDYNHMMREMAGQTKGLVPVRGSITRTVSVIQPSPFARVQRLFRRGRSRRSG